MMMDTCFDDLLDQAVAEMSSGQRRRFERRCKWVPGYRQAYVRELADNVLDDPRFIEAAPMAAAMMASDSFTGQTRFQIDGSKIRIILDIIIEYGPKLLDVILLFVKVFTFALVFAIALPAASAAYPKPAETAYPMPSQTAQVQAPSMSAFIESKGDQLDDHLLAQWGKSVGNCPGGVCPLPAPSSNMSRVNYSVPQVQVRQVRQPANVVHNQSSGYITAERDGYVRQWYNHDGMSLRQHAEVMHGHDTAGLSDSQVAALNDHDHNSWGHGGHPHAHRTQASQSTAMYGRARMPIARAAVVGGGRIVRGTARATARVATAPVRVIRRVQPVRRIVRGLNALRPVNITRRVRGRIAYRRGCY